MAKSELEVKKEISQTKKNTPQALKGSEILIDTTKDPKVG